MTTRKKTKSASKSVVKKVVRVERRPKKVVRVIRRPNPESAPVVEDYGGFPYEYIQLGKYIVAARGVCGGRPTIKYHRLDARWILAFYENGDSMSQLAKWYKIPLAAVKEVIALADDYDYEKRYI